MKFKLLPFLITAFFAIGNLSAAEVYYMSVLADDSEPVLFAVTDNLIVKSGGDKMTVSDGATSYTFENLTRLSFEKRDENSIDVATAATPIVTVNGKTVVVKCVADNNCYSVYNAAGIIVDTASFGVETTIDLGRFPTGAYIVRINSLPAIKALIK